MFVKVIEVIEVKVASQGFCAAVSERVEAPKYCGRARGSYPPDDEASRIITDRN